MKTTHTNLFSINLACLEFRFIILYDRRAIRFKAVLVASNEQIEHYRIVGRNRSIVVEGNRPLLRSKGLKHRRIQWKLKEGTMSNSHLFENIIKKLEEYID